MPVLSDREKARREVVQRRCRAAWVNFTAAINDDLNSKDEARTKSALMQMVKAHDLVDEEGRPFPPAEGPAFWDEVNPELGRVIVQAIVAQIGKLDPKQKSS